MRVFIILSLFLLATLLHGQKYIVMEDLRYTEGNEEKHNLDLYLPAGVENAPVLIWIHGGAWAFGDRKKEKELASQFVRKGIVVAVISYRLSPALWADPKFDQGIQHPEHIQDVAQAFKWVHQQATRYGYSQSRIFVSGYSSGGHLAALLASDGHYLDDVGLSTSNIRGVIPIAGAYDILSYYQTHYKFNSPKMAEQHVKAVFGYNEEDLVDASPTQYVEKLKTPMLLISESQSYKYTKIYEDALKSANVKNITYLHVREFNHKEFYARLAKDSTSKYRDQIIDFILYLTKKDH